MGLPAVGSARDVSRCRGTPSGVTCAPACLPGYNMVGNVTCKHGLWKVAGQCLPEGARTKSVPVARFSLKFNVERMASGDRAPEGVEQWAREHLRELTSAVARLLNVSTRNLLVEIIPSSPAAGRRLGAAALRLSVVVSLEGLTSRGAAGSSVSGSSPLEAAAILERRLAAAGGAEPGALGLGVALAEELALKGESAPFAIVLAGIEVAVISEGYPFPEAEWQVSPWSECNAAYGEGHSVRSVVCTAGHTAACVVALGAEPDSVRPCVGPESSGTRAAAANTIVFVLGSTAGVLLLACALGRRLCGRGRAKAKAEEAGSRAELRLPERCLEEGEAAIQQQQKQQQQQQQPQDEETAEGEGEEEQAPEELIRQYETWREHVLRRMGSQGQCQLPGLNMDASFRVTRAPTSVAGSQANLEEGVLPTSSASAAHAEAPTEKVRIVWQVDVESVMLQLAQAQDAAAPDGAPQCAAQGHAHRSAWRSSRASTRNKKSNDCGEEAEEGASPAAAPHASRRAATASASPRRVARPRRPTQHELRVPSGSASSHGGIASPTRSPAPKEQRAPSGLPRGGSQYKWRIPAPVAETLPKEAPSPTGIPKGFSRPSIMSSALRSATSDESLDSFGELNFGLSALAAPPSGADIFHDGSGPMRGAMVSKRSVTRGALGLGATSALTAKARP